MDEYFPYIYVIALARVAAFMVFLPVEGRGLGLKAGKAVIALVMTVVIVPFHDLEVPAGLNEAPRFFLYMGAEVLFGGLVGFTLRTLFQLFTVAGQMMSQQMGLALARISDPLTGAEVRVLGIFCNMLGMLLFLAVDGHLVILRALHQSFTLWPPGVFLRPELARDVTVAALVRSFSMAFQMASPVLLLAFTINLSMALLARLVPQINILIMGFALRIGAGLIGLAMFLPLIVHFMSGVIDLMYEFVYAIISA